MKLRRISLILIATAILLGLTVCSPQEAAPTPDTIGTVAAQLAYGIMTQTAAAASPTASPVTHTVTPVASETPTLTLTPSEPPAPPRLNKFASCWLGGPGQGYELDSNINQNRKVEIVGVGSVEGWYVIVNPYFHKHCWIAAEDLTIDPAMDLSWLPVMTPIP